MFGKPAISFPVYRSKITLIERNTAPNLSYTVGTDSCSRPPIFERAAFRRQWVKIDVQHRVEKPCHHARTPVGSQNDESERRRMFVEF